jgi:thiamine-phosphate pyrophosphorylase
MIAAPSLIAITDAAHLSFGVWLVQLERLLAAARPGSVQVQLRDRQLPLAERRQLGGRLRQVTTQHGQGLAVNDRLDLAVLLAADAVHLPEGSVSADDARAFGERHGLHWFISSACHDPQRAASSSADGLLLSPIAQPRKGRPALGVDGLARARAALSERPRQLCACRVYALGGVGASDAQRWIAAGADGVALIGALLDADAPGMLVEQLGLQR